MFANLFGPRTARRSGRDRSFRPELERLHDRVLPSGFHPMDDPGDHGKGHGGDQGGDGGDQGGPPPGHQGPPPGSVTTINSFNTTTIVNSFNAINSNNAVSLTMQLNIGQLNVLVNDEIMLAFNSVIASIGPMLGLNTAMFQSNMNALQNAINQNPMEHNPLGQLFGMLAFDAARSNLGAPPVGL